MFYRKNFLFLITFFISHVLCAQDIVFVKVNCGGVAGLGNQLFQFAAAYNLAKRIGAKLKAVVDKKTTFASKNPGSRDYILNTKDFCLDGVEFVYEEELKKAPWHMVCESNYFLECKGAARIFVTGGFFESAIFFDEAADDIKKIFTQKNTKTLFIQKHLPDIEKCNSVAIHIRRGDFKGYNWRILPITYYVKAMEKFSNQKDVTFFVFSDDPDYAKECFTNLANVKIISDGSATSLEELYLMTQCKHLIIANSTFSWWAAYLCKNPKATIIAPFPKYKEEYNNGYGEGQDRKEAIWIHTKGAFPSHWQTINPFTLEEPKSTSIFDWFKNFFKDNKQELKKEFAAIR